MAETTSAPKSADNDKILAAVATLPVVGLIMFFAMKDASPLVKHYAKQSNAILAIWIVMSVLIMILSAITFGVGALLGCLTWIVPVAVNVLLIIKAYNGEPSYVLPVIGDFFDKLIK